MDQVEQIGFHNWFVNIFAAVLTHSNKAIELEDLKGRISELERTAEVSKQR